MKITRIKYGYDSNKNNDTVNCDCRNISITKIRSCIGWNQCWAHGQTSLQYKCCNMNSGNWIVKIYGEVICSFYYNLDCTDKPKKTEL